MSVLVDLPDGRSVFCRDVLDARFETVAGRACLVVDLETTEATLVEVYDTDRHGYRLRVVDGRRRLDDPDLAATVASVTV